ncbi:SDR family oxidoreductase [Nonomuraea typhae]|uniref:SDR family oxidoreductase n=1 Tax=Nonomuraea typhae TaxID=2603600 RepID=UPI001FEB63B7|nr:NAD(P)H-binding protein [Nonomuraea typhae]
MNEILVLGATGKTGRRIVPQLRAKGHKVRAASRSGETLFDWTRPETWAPAVAGAGAVYLIAPDDPAPVHAFVRQAEQAGVGRFVVLSGRNMDKVTNGFGEGMKTAEAAVRETGAEWTVIRANNFHQNFSEDLWLEPVRQGRLALPVGAMTEPFIDIEDVAAVAVELLTGGGEPGQVYEVSGPEGLTFAEAAEIIGAAAGRPVRFEELTPEGYRAELTALDYPEEVVSTLDTMFALIRAGLVTGLGDGVQKALGREPAGFRDYARRTAATGVWS